MPKNPRRPPPVLVDGHKEWLVDRIVCHYPPTAVPSAATHFLVLWTGYPDEEGTWEPLAHVEDTLAFYHYRTYGPFGRFAVVPLALESYPEFIRRLQTTA
jgi:hypothetical protein